MILDDQSDVIVNLESICNQGTLSPSEDYSAPSAQELFRLAMEKFNSSDIEASIDLLSQAIEADPSSFQYYAARAEGYRYIQDRRAAISDYESTIEMIKSNGTVDDAQLIEYYENRLMTLGQ
jgi:Tfp pilus assembly protein PilF